jgi:tetratricopeptide (TPR) repeat protein
MSCAASSNCSTASTETKTQPSSSAIIARGEGDRNRALSAFAKTRDILVERLKQKADHPRTLAVLAQVDAGLGKKEEALREAKRAVELMPTTRDAYDAPLVLQGLAQVYAWTGEKDLAIKTLEQILTVPGYLTYGYLHVDPAWDPLRGDRRFEALVASLGPSKI